MLTFLGDVSLISNKIRSEYKPNNPYIFNCEYVIENRPDLKPVPGKINLKGNNHNYEMLFGSNPIAVALTNNHINDFGEEGFTDTEEILKSKGIITSSGNPIWIENICILPFMDLKSNNERDNKFLFDKTIALKNIMNAKRVTGAKIVVLVHWGIENDFNPNAQQIQHAHWLIDNGADIIIGHHPHCIQKVEKYKGKFIFYSLGNGLFPPINQKSHFDIHGKPTRTYRFRWQRWNRKSYAVTLDSSARVVDVQLLFQTKDGVLKPKGKVSKNKLLSKKKSSRFIYLLRKYYLFFVSNCFVDGKLFDINSIKMELKK